MSRRTRREFIARTVTFAAITLPVTSAILVAIVLHTLLGWEGRAGLVVVIGAVFSITFGITAVIVWDDYSDTVRYTHLKCTSFLRDWIEEPEEVKSTPKPGAWNEETHEKV